MPCGRHAVVRAGERSKWALLHAVDRRLPGDGRTGLSHASPGASAAYVREGEWIARGIRLVPRGAEWMEGGFAEVDAGLLPGLYQLGLPDEMFAPGAPSALLVVSFDGALIEPVVFTLVGYEPGDADRLGLGCLDQTYHVDVLRRALAGLAEFESDAPAGRPSSNRER